VIRLSRPVNSLIIRHGVSMQISHTENILLIDDNPVNNQLMATYLLPCGYTIQIAENGSEGLRLAAENSPDLILLDVMMPDMDGYEVCRRLRAEAATAEIPVLFITADASPDNHRRAFSVGGNDFITKPIYETVLRARVANLINLFQARRRVEELNKHHALSQKISQTGHWSYEWQPGARPLFCCSPQLLDLLDLRQGELHVLSLENLLSFFTAGCDARERITKSWARAQREGGCFRELINCQINGKKKNVRIWAEFEAANPKIRAFGSVQDVTGLMEMIYEEAALENRLAQNDRYSALVESGTQLAHELNQPLASITLNVNAAKLFLESAVVDKAELFEIIRDVESEVMRAKSVVDRMRAVASRKPLLVERFDLAALIRKTARIFARDFSAGNITLVQNQLDAPCFVSGDKAAVQQVLVNIMKNASESLQSSSGANRQVTLTLAESPDRVEICVADNGPGISDAVKESLFLPFVTTKAENLGLGLAVSKSIATRLGGAISVLPSAENGGAGFCLSLPRDFSVS